MLLREVLDLWPHMTYALFQDGLLSFPCRDVDYADTDASPANTSAEGSSILLRKTVDLAAACDQNLLDTWYNLTYTPFQDALLSSLSQQSQSLGSSGCRWLSC